jgi:hypothetical protein
MYSGTQIVILHCITDICSWGRVASTSLVCGIPCMDISVYVILQPHMWDSCMDISVYVILQPRMWDSLHGYICLCHPAASTSLVCGILCMDITVHGVGLPGLA